MDQLLVNNSWTGVIREAIGLVSLPLPPVLSAVGNGRKTQGSSEEGYVFA